MSKIAKKTGLLGSDHPFSLLTLLSSEKDTRMKITEGEEESSSSQQDFNHYQTQAADLSLTGPQEQLPLSDIYSLNTRSHVFTEVPLANRPPEYTGNSPVPPPPPLAHHQPYEDNFYQNPGINQNGDYIGQHGQMHEYEDTLSHYNEYYNRYNYSEQIQHDSTVPEDRNDRLFDYSLTSNVKEEISNQPFRYIDGGSSNYLVPPPLHPSPAVLLHINYVMESVCDWMFFTDVIIVTSSDTLRAHRSVLSAHSSFLCYLFSELGEGDDPVIYFPHHASLYVRMLLQFFYTGEVTRMTQGDIEPLRDICFCLGITSLITRLDDVKLTISFQSIPSYDAQIPHVETQVKGTTASEPIYSDLRRPEENSGTRLADKPCLTPEPLEENTAGQSSCKFQEQKDKSKTKSKNSDVDYARSPTRQYTVVSKMPRDTKLQISKKCSKCDLKFFKAESYENHLKLHKGEAFKCEICGKNISSKYHLNIHMQTHANKKYSCNFSGCSKEFSDPSALRRHHRNAHAEIKHVCPKCGASFGDRNSWKRHVNDHAPLVMFSCDICVKAFKRKSQLKRHRTNVHKSEQLSADKVKDEDKPDAEKKCAAATCDQCGAVFRKPYDLKIHMRVHTGEKPFKCTMCNKSFSRSYNLQLHTRTHTGEKPHACARCGRCFSDVAAFRRHCRTHSGERPYPCTICGARFTQASTAYNHMCTCRKKRHLSDAVPFQDASKQEPETKLPVIVN